MLNNTIKKELKIQKILPVFNTSNIINDIERLELYLSKNSNVKVIEVTLRSEDSFEIAKKLKENFPNIRFGLGSILHKNDYDKGIQHGFEFFVSPGIISDLSKNKTLDYIPGGETISEFLLLNSLGYEIIKFFPSNLSGGQKKLLSIKNILKEVSFIPTGGINYHNYLDYLSLENVLCVGMSQFDN